ncbi:conserved hypothetical protein [Streptomyces scabiei 87.22]|uniref:Uncharacterized protein n=1 Tax=Streptomyces scabiei (strain 87.22) TaxID=680198 RepID=C9Z1H5_STRSW|nr:conserved hypothetical protein [Streptomyces scabiei 87.22]
MPAGAAEHDERLPAGTLHPPAHGGDVAGQRRTRRGAGLGPQHDGHRAEPLDRRGERLGGDGRAEHPGGYAEFAERRAERLQRQAVLFAGHAGQDDGAGGGGVVTGRGCPGMAAQGGGDVPGQQVFHLHVTVAGRGPLAAHRVQGRHHHVLPGRRQPVPLDGPGQQVLHGRGVEAYGGAGEAPALLAGAPRGRRPGGPGAAPVGQRRSPGSLLRLALRRGRGPRTCHACRLARGQSGGRQPAHLLQHRHVPRAPAPVPAVSADLGPDAVAAVPGPQRGG